MQGFAYVEFEKKDSLEKALAKSGVQFKGRALFIAVSNPTRGGRGDQRGRGRSFGDRGGGRCLTAPCLHLWTFSAPIMLLCTDVLPHRAELLCPLLGL